VSVAVLLLLIISQGGTVHRADRGECAGRAGRRGVHQRPGRHADQVVRLAAGTGFGSILGHIAPIIGLGTVLGAVLERSGGADVLTTRLLTLFGPKGAPLAMGLTGLILGIPVFFDIGCSWSRRWFTSRPSAADARWCSTRCRCSPGCP